MKTIGLIGLGAVGARIHNVTKEVAVGGEFSKFGHIMLVANPHKAIFGHLARYIHEELWLLWRVGACYR
jgi:hypothetical protein